MLQHAPTTLLLCCALLGLASTAWAEPAESPPQPTQPTQPSAGEQSAQPVHTAASEELFLARRKALAAGGEALRRADDAVPAVRQRADEPLDYSQILNSEPNLDDSLSVGTVRSGALKNPAELAHTGPYHQVIEPHRRRNTHYGTEELIDAIETAAADVTQSHGGAPLRVGNLGYAHGGPIPWSGSHQAGRDADIAFYSLDAQGNSVPTPNLVEFDDDGRAIGQPLYFDTARNWALARSLLTNPDINVVWLFVSEGLKRLMLEHAVEINEPRRLIERAAKVLHQPTDAPPHADHFHLRIGCPEADRLNGCLPWGPQWDWYDWHEERLFARTRELRRAFDNDSPNLRRQALEYLHDIRAPHGPEIALHYGLHDPDSDVQAASYDLLDEVPIDTLFGLKRLADALDAADELTSDRKQTLYHALRLSGRADDAAELAVARLKDTTLSDDERRLALRALRHRMKPHIVPALTDLLREEDSPRLREAIARQIRRITVYDQQLDWSDSLTDEHLAALDLWEQRAADMDPDRRDALVDMLADYGVDGWKDLEAVDDLIPLLSRGDDYKRYNLNLLLSEWTGRWASPDWNGRRAHEFWSNWWNRNRDRQLDDTPNPWE